MLGLFCFAMCVRAEELILNIETAGTLAQLLGDQKLTVTDLKLSGHLNSDDITCLKEMTALKTLDVAETDADMFTSFAHSGIVSIVLPKVLKKLSSFSQCKQMESIVLPEGLTSISQQAFYDCSSLKSINIPEGITSIPYYAFNGCGKLKSIELPQSLTDIAESAFNRSGIESIVIPANVLKIGDRAFAKCWSLRSVVLPEGLNAIGQEAFRGSGLQSVRIPGSVTSIEYKAFGECESLKMVHVLEGTGSIRQGIIEGSTPCCLIWDRADNIPSSLFEFYSTPPSHNNFLVYVKNDVVVPEDWSTAQIIRDGMADSIGISNESGWERFYVAQSFKAKKIVYSRSFDMESGYRTAAGWQSIVLPFTVSRFSHETKGELAPFGSNISGAFPFWLRELTAEGYVVSSTLEANKPYIISMPNNAEYEEEYNITGMVTFSAEDPSGVEVSVTPDVMPIGETADYKLVPTYETVELSDTVYALNTEVYGKNPAGSVFVKRSRDVPCFEAYVVSKQSRAFAPEMYSIDGGGGSITALEKILLKEESTLKIYSQRRTLYIESDKPRSIPLYGIDGVLVRSLSISEGKNTIDNLPCSIYFLEGKKVILRD